MRFVLVVWKDLEKKNIKSVCQETVKNVKEKEEVKVEILRILDSF